MRDGGSPFRELSGFRVLVGTFREDVPRGQTYLPGLLTLRVRPHSGSDNREYFTLTGVGTMDDSDVAPVFWTCDEQRDGKGAGL
jgi:hypothetical protein